ncbi:hypothetical protein N6H05_09955 [Sphingobium sp. WTD-1]|uniref:hypothetical protein n=1 Tax=Sphingobium sp. WTD-1 TaxID=2979467 RepID=UPI0024DEA5CB|nr:hypothetical protein [Sphingobium sp. WTD-1]WIA58091.1 hypothetical protein N6H05_09955 [Sphingobium sp. WTD-1]
MEGFFMRARFALVAMLALASCGQSPKAESFQTAQTKCDRFPGVGKDPIPLEFQVSLTGGRRPQVNIVTNLPEGTEVNATLKSPGFPPNYIAQDEGSVACGKLLFGPFSKQGNELPSGLFELSVTAPLVIVQPKPVQKYLGTDYNVFRSELITKRKSPSELGGSTIEWKTTLNFRQPS